MPNEFKVKNGLIVDQGGATITGSLSVNGNVGIGTNASTFNLDVPISTGGGVRFSGALGGNLSYSYAEYIGAYYTAGWSSIGNIGLRSGASQRILISNTDQSRGIVLFGNRLGLANATPLAKLHITGEGSGSATTTLLVQNSTPTTLFQIQDHGSSSFNGNLTVTGSFNQGSASLASGLFSHVQGFNTTASGIYSHAEGQNARATGQYSHAEGGNAQAVGNYSHAEGQGTAANGAYSHAEGWATISTGQASHAEGLQTTATGDYSHTEGLFTSTIGEMSHAEGVQTVAGGVGSHAEGGWYYFDDGDFIFPGGTAAGNASHAEGLSTLASGEGAHAEGYYATASGYASHAEGLGTVALGNYQHVQGQYNLSSLAESAFIIGNGVDASNRSNLVFASNSQFQITGSLIVLGPTAVQENLADNALYNGQIIQASVDAATTDFQLVYLDTDGIWYPLKNLAIVSTKMVGICVDAAGGYVLIEGDIGVSDDGSQGAVVSGADFGLPVYISSTTGEMTTTVPVSGVIRILGHIYYQSSTNVNLWTMKFRPSNDWYEI